MQTDTISTVDDRFPHATEGIDALLKNIVNSLVNLWDCETLVLKLQSEFLQTAARERRDREFLDLSA